VLTAPDVPLDAITHVLREHYGLAAREVQFLPLGADADAAVDRAALTQGAAFVKLSRRPQQANALAVQAHMRQAGMPGLIPMHRTHTGELSARIGDYGMTCAHFIAGDNAWRATLTRAQWRAFGQALKHLHTLPVPGALAQQLPRETFGDVWRTRLREAIKIAMTHARNDASMQALRTQLVVQRAHIAHALARAGALAAHLRAHPLPQVLCHGDIHAGNLMLAGDGALYVVDWDAPVLAPKERDLMFIGSGMGFEGWATDEEAALFAEGYGAHTPDAHALAWFRYERVIIDLALYIDDICVRPDDDPDRAQALRYFGNNFDPGGTLACAERVDPQG
jgi:spectinomycin phosphotransferase